MRERKYVKFRIDMYDDTKFKIIDRRPERDLIHYVWNRVVVLAGKVNQEGELYMSKNIPYTVNILAIEFNRNPEEVKLALDVLIELEMIEFAENRIYIVTNFAKHQNIKVKEKNKSKDKEVDLEGKEVQVEENSKSGSIVKEDKEAENKINEKESENVEKEETANLQINQKAANKVEENITNNKVNDSSQDSIPPKFLEVKRNKSGSKQKKKEREVEMTHEDEDVICFKEGDNIVGKGEDLIMEFLMFN